MVRNSSFYLKEKEMRRLFVFTLSVFLWANTVSAVTRQGKKLPTVKPSLSLGCSNALRSQAEFRAAFKDPKALEKQNFVIDLWNLERVEDERDLWLLTAAGRLVPVCFSGWGYYIDQNLSKKTHFVRDFTEGFIRQLAGDFYRATQLSKIRFITNPKTSRVRQVIRGEIRRLKITGLVRDRPYQARLVRRLPKGQAASDENGPKCQSSHLAGTTFDLSVRDLSAEETCWIQEYLYQKHNAYRISVIWEEQSKVFHVMVFPFPTFTDHIY